MAKNSITDYSKTAASNTDIQSVDIDEGCLPSGINNAIRELMADLADMNDGTVSLTSPSFAAASLTGDLSFGDGNKAIFGAGGDLVIQHNGGDSLINDVGTGNLKIQTNGTAIELNTTGGSALGHFTNNGDVKLFYQGSEKLATTSTGINVTGTVTADGLTVDGTGAEVISVNSTANGSQINFDSATSSSDWSIGIANDATDDFLIYQAAAGAGDIKLYTDGKERVEVNNNGDISFYEDTGTTAKLTWDASGEDLRFADNSKAIFGAGSDLQIYHDGSNSIIRDAGTGGLHIRASANLQLQDSDGYLYVNCIDGGNGGTTKLYNLNQEKLATTSTGIDVTGTVTADGLTVSSGSNQITLDTGDQTTYGRLDVGHFSNGAFIGTYAGTNAAANILRFGTSGTERMRIDSSGRVGIGTSSPDGKLHIDGASDTVTGLVFEAGVTGDNKFIDFQNTSGAKRMGVEYDNNNVRLSIVDRSENKLLTIKEGDGNVGIGTSSPDSALMVTDDSNYKVRIGFNGTSQNIYDANENVFRAANGTEIARFKSNGRVGIGTSSPSTNLHVSSSGDTIVRVTSADGNGAFLDLGDASDPDGGRIVYDSGSNLTFSTASTERMRIDSSGRVGIGTTSPEGTLHVENVSNNSLIMDAPANRFNSIGFQTAGVDKWWLGRADSDQISGDAFFIGIDNGNVTDAGGLSNKLVITQSGNVGIGTGSPSANLHISDPNPIIRLDENDQTNHRGLIQFNSNALRIRARADTARGAIRFEGDNGTDVLEYARFNSQGYLGIGASSPSSVLHIANATPEIFLEDTDTGAGSGKIIANNGNIGIVSDVNNEFASSLIYFTIDGSEKARLNASGNLLVGTTTTDPNSTAGAQLASNGRILATVDGGNAGYFNRLTSDGELVRFEKDGSTIGSIGTVAGDIVVGTGTAGLRFWDSGPAIQPRNSDGSANNDAIDLGISTSRFKDLHLSGTAYAGTSAGIGTTSVYEKLTIGGADETSLTNQIAVRASDNDDIFRIRTNNSTEQVSIEASGDSGNGFITFGTGSGSAERMRIDSSGRVGIGSTAPDKTLVVSSSSGTEIVINDSDATPNPILRFRESGSTSSTISTSSNNLIFSTPTTERMRINSSGILLHGTTSTSNTVRGVRINGDVGSAGGQTLNDAIASGAGQYEGCQTGLGYQSFMNLNMNNSTAIGLISFQTQSSLVGSIQWSSSTSYNTSSDYRLKENVVSLTGGIERLKQLEPKRFNFISDAGITVDGFLAHEAQTAIPHAITGEKDAVDKDGNPEYQCIDHSKFVPLLTAALQEAIAKIEDLEARVATLEGN